MAVDSSTALAFSLDGKELLYFSHKQGLKAIDVETGRERATVQPRFLLDGEIDPSNLWRSVSSRPIINISPPAPA